MIAVTDKNDPRIVLEIHHEQWTATAKVTRSCRIHQSQRYGRNIRPGFFCSANAKQGRDYHGHSNRIYSWAVVLSAACMRLFLRSIQSGLRKRTDFARETWHSLLCGRCNSLAFVWALIVNRVVCLTRTLAIKQPSLDVANEYQKCGIPPCVENGGMTTTIEFWHAATFVNQRSSQGIDQPLPLQN